MAEHFIECPTRKNMAISAENRTQDQKWGSTGQNWRKLLKTTYTEERIVRTNSESFKKRFGS